MFKRKFSEFIFGLLHFRATEGFREEFLSECSKRKIIIEDLETSEEGLCGYIQYLYRESLFEAAKSSGMRIEILSRYGLPDFVIRYRKRYGVPLGILIFVILSAVLHSVIWTVDISGTENIPREEIIETLDNAGVREGAFSDTIDCKEAEYILYKAFPGISWTNVHIIGSRLYVDIREVQHTEEIKEKQYSNIIAGKDGEIINAEIFCGEGKIYPGTAVVKGDLLVSGIINHRDGSVKFVDSEAKIFARTNNFISSRMPLKFSALRPDKCKEYYLPEFFGVSLCDVLNVKNKAFTINRCYISDSDVVLPVGIARVFLFGFSEEEIKLNESQALLLCFRDFALSALKLYKRTEVIESDITADISDGAEISGSFLTIEDIALKKAFTVEEN